VLLAQCPREWADAVTSWHALAHDHRSAAGPDARPSSSVWQTLVGAWPLSADRAVAYVEKATREAKDRTSWTEPEPAFDEAVASFVRGVLGDERIRTPVAAFVAGLSSGLATTSLAQKAVQLTVPGVADTYQGTELWDLSLVDPDNRRPGRLRRAAGAAGARRRPAVDETGAAKLHVVSRLLRLRRDRPELFLDASSYSPLDAGSPRGGVRPRRLGRHRRPDAALQVERSGLGRRRRRAARRAAGPTSHRCGPRRRPGAPRRPAGRLPRGGPAPQLSADPPLPRSNRAPRALRRTVRAGVVARRGRDRTPTRAGAAP
jgi:(1->4)-alpha-D-glucan 1-alpha-D-glucosylmutase